MRSVLATRAELDAERALRQQLEDQNERLPHFIRQLQRMQFGRRSEKLDPDQLALGLEDLEQAVAESPNQCPGTRNPRSP
jgi:transposase